MSGRTNVAVPAAGPAPSGYLGEVARLLWPQPARVTVERGAPAVAHPDTRELLLLPGAASPRLLLPAGERRAAAAAMRHYGEPRSRLARLRARTLAAALRSGAGDVLLRDRLRVHTPEGVETMERHLHRVFGEPVLLSLHVGPPRANRKPVLQLLTAEGRTVGFAKVGVNALTNALVAAERDALAALADAGLLTTAVPAVLHHGTWRDCQVLVLEPLPVWKRRAPATEGPRLAAMWEVAASGGLRTQELRDSPFWHRLEAGAGNLSGGAAGAVRLALADIAAADGHRQLTFGAWHGDWNPGNMAVLHDRVLLWDWERYAADVPVGFDPLHFAVQTDITYREQPPELAVRRCLDGAAELLRPFDVAPQDSSLVAVLYLAHLAVRYLRDGQAEAGADLGRLESWLLPSLRTAAARLRNPA